MSYQDVMRHRGMIFDGVRNAAYTRALEKVVTAKKTVLDLGAGLGIHGLIAAQIGAKKVYLVEPTVSLEVAKKVAADNHLDNVECLRSTVEELNLNVKVDVISSALTGNFLLAEDLLPMLFYARDRFLAPGGKLIPDYGFMEIVPVSAPDYYGKYVASWGDFPRYSVPEGMPALDYSAVLSYATHRVRFDQVNRMQAKRLAEPTRVMELDFNIAKRADCDSRLRVRAKRAGVCHGWLGWFQVRLADEWLSTDRADTHWQQAFFPLAKPLAIEKGEHIDLQMKRPERGEWTWITSFRGEKQRQCSLFSRPMSRQDRAKIASNYRPSVSSKAEAAQWALSSMQGEMTTSELAQAVAKRFPKLFPNEVNSLRFVRELIDRFN